MLQGIKDMFPVILILAIWICLSIALSLFCNCDISTCDRSGVICDWPRAQDGIPSKILLASLLIVALEFLVGILGVLFVAMVLLYEKIFHRTITGIKPNGDQQEPIGRFVIKPFNRISMV